MTWDEPWSFFQGVKILQSWLGNLGLPGFFSKELTQQYWPFIPEENRWISTYNYHPPMTLYAGFTGLKLFGSFAPEWIAMRWGVGLIFSSALAIMYLWMDEFFDKRAAILAVVFLFFSPRVLGHANLISSETLLMSFWIFGLYSFSKAEKKFSVFHLLFLFSVTGALLTKVTALLLWGAFLLSIFIRKKYYLTPYLFFSIILLVIFNPTFWYLSIKEIFDMYILSAIARKDYLDIGGYYLGHLTNQGQQAWHYSLVMTGFTLPVIVLVGCVLKLFFLRKITARGVHLFLHGVIILLPLFLPHAPQYDGVRHFLPIFIYLSIMAGIGWSECIQRISKKYQKMNMGRIIVPGLMLACVCPALNAAPHYLSYYNCLIGGRVGAVKRGMEVSYWFESLDPKSYQVINEKLPKNVKLLFLPLPTHFSFLQYAGMLREDFVILPTVQKPDYLIQYSRLATITAKPLQTGFYTRGDPLYSYSPAGVVFWEIFDLSVEENNRIWEQYNG